VRVCVYLEESSTLISLNIEVNSVSVFWSQSFSTRRQFQAPLELLMSAFTPTWSIRSICFDEFPVYIQMYSTAKKNKNNLVSFLFFTEIKQKAYTNAKENQDSWRQEIVLSLESYYTPNPAICMNYHTRALTQLSQLHTVWYENEEEQSHAVLMIMINAF